MQCSCIDSYLYITLFSFLLISTFGREPTSHSVANRSVAFGARAVCVLVCGPTSLPLFGLLPMGKRGGESAKIASVRSDLADRLEREYRLQPHLASQCAGQVAEAAGGDPGRCSGKWLRNATEIPSGYVCYMLRALEDHLSGSPVDVSAGGRQGAPGKTDPAAMGTGLHSMAMVAPREAAVEAAATNEAATKAAAAGEAAEAAARTAATCEAAVNRDTAAADEAAAKAAAAGGAAAKATATAEDNTTTRGISQPLPSQGAASEANSVTAHFLALLEAERPSVRRQN